MLLFILALVAYYVYIRLSCGVTRSASCLVGKTALVTGANSGLGYQTVLNLASRGCKVIMADVVNMQETKRNVTLFTNNSNIITKHLDLSSLKSVRDFASDINKTEGRLDILVNNAGIGFSNDNKTSDGLHSAMQINYFGHFLLTHLLIDLLKNSSPSRIVWTSSCAAFFHYLTLNNLNLDDEHGNFFNKLGGYNNSKFAMLIASDLFAAKLKGTGVTSNTVHPGVVTTPIFSKMYTINKITIINFVLRLYNWIYSKDAWEGSQVLVHVAVSKQLEKVTGKYFWDCKPFIKPRKASDKVYCESIWKASEEYVQLRPEERLK